MNSYIAFLRGINVGGHNKIKMNDLKDIFISLGLTDVKTYIQSGNVRFCSPESDSKVLQEKIEKILGNHIPVILRTHQELNNIVQNNVFKDFLSEKNLKFYICFLDKIPEKKPVLPLIIEKDGIEVLQIINKDVFVVNRPVPGRTGFPNNFIEKVFGVISTARNLNTIEKIVEDNLSINILEK
jgi:uncharacterized protein (DUF1697 family)